MTTAYAAAPTSTDLTAPEQWLEKEPTAAGNDYAQRLEQFSLVVNGN